MGNATSALVNKNSASIISNKRRHYKMAARAVHSKNHMTQETEKTLKGLYRYYSYVQLNMWSLLLTSPTLAPTFKCLLCLKFNIFSKCKGAFVAILCKSIGDLQFSYLYPCLLDHLLQKNYTEYYA